MNKCTDLRKGTINSTRAISIAVPKARHLERVVRGVCQQRKTSIPGEGASGAQTRRGVAGGRHERLHVAKLQHGRYKIGAESSEMSQEQGQGPVWPPGHLYSITARRWVSVSILALPSLCPSQLV